MRSRKSELLVGTYAAGRTQLASLFASSFSFRAQRYTSSRFPTSGHVGKNFRVFRKGVHIIFCKRTGDISAVFVFPDLSRFSFNFHDSAMLTVVSFFICSLLLQSSFFFFFSD